MILSHTDHLANMAMHPQRRVIDADARALTADDIAAAKKDALAAYIANGFVRAAYLAEGFIPYEAVVDGWFTEGEIMFSGWGAVYNLARDGWDIRQQ